MVFRCVLPKWAVDEFPDRRRVQEGEFTDEELLRFNELFYNIYFLPNGPSLYDPSKIVKGSDIDQFNFVFVDMDLKDGKYATKDAFIETLASFSLEPTMIVDSGNGVHAYWRVSDLDAMSYLKLQRRLIRRFSTDDSLAKIYQLMRCPGFVNPKHKHGFRLCEKVYESEAAYTAEILDSALPPLSKQDEEYCNTHFDRTYEVSQPLSVDDKIPLSFMKLLRTNKEVKKIWSGDVDDRSVADFRLGHLMFAEGLSKDEAMSVLVNSVKALERAPAHRINYAAGIVEKIWTYELTQEKDSLDLSSTVKDILARSGEGLKGTRFPCYEYLDNTEHGFRLGQVIGLVAGSGVGKTAVALNMFMGFVKANPDYEHFFVPLEQPANEIADRWRSLCGTNTRLYEKVHVISNYAEDGSFRHLSFEEIKDYLLKFKRLTDKQIGCVVIDHIGALKKAGRDGENQDIMDICHAMKAFAIQTNTLLVMQSQTSREKAGIGDLELNKDAAYGTVFFESYCDYLITLWQPLKRCYSEEACPTVTAIKFCKIRHKKKGKDKIQEDVRYLLAFDPETESLRELNEDEEKMFGYWNAQATNQRKKDRKTDIVPYVSMRWTKEQEDDEIPDDDTGADRKASSNQNSSRP